MSGGRFRRTSAAVIGVLVAVLLLTATPASPASAAATSSTFTDVVPVRTGWVDEGGYLQSGGNYAAGYASPAFHGRFRNFFVFDLAGVSGTVVSATLVAVNPSSMGAPDTYTLYDVTTPSTVFETEEAEDASAVFADLGTGTVLGSATLSDATTSPVIVPLNAAGVAEVQSALGAPLVIGGDYAPESTLDQVIFLNTHLPGSDVKLILETVPAPTATLESPYTTWSQPVATPLDGLGTWMATANDPVGVAGQVAPDYLYALGFSFAGSSARGVVGLVTTPGGKQAGISVVEADGTAHNAAVPFAWEAGRFYFPFVYQLSPGQWGAWVYDFTAAAWTVIGVLTLPEAWGKLSPDSYTSVGWLGDPAGSCSGYPRAEVFAHAPTGFVGSTAVEAARTGAGVVPGDCAADPILDAEGWAFYRVGAPLVVLSPATPGQGR